MTMSIHMRVQPERTRAVGTRRGPLDSLLDMPTELIRLSPAFLDALREVAPKVRPRRLRYVVALVALASLGVWFGRRFVVHSPLATLVTASGGNASVVAASVVGASAPPVERAPTLSVVADSLATRAGAIRPDNVAVASPSGKAANHAATAAAAAAPAVAVDDLPRVATPNAKKNRSLQTPR
jgi:hypothetical protein